MNLQAKLLFCPDSRREMDVLVDQWNDLRIKTIYLLGQQIDRPHVGESLTRFDGEKWVVIQTLLDTELGRFPVAISDRGEAIGEGDGAWLKMLCPRGVDNSGRSIREFRKDQIRRMIQLYNPVGISLDFIRHFVFWESIYENASVDSIPRSCFCSTCRTTFSEIYGISLPESVAEAISTIVTDYIREWEQFAELTITNLVEELSCAAKEANPSIKMNIHLVPWNNSEFSQARQKRVGQNLSALTPFIDQISPMCYSPMLQRSSEWIAELVKMLADESGRPVIPAVQICEMYGTKVLSSKELRDMILAAGESPSGGVVIWPWERVTESQLAILADLNS